METKSTVQNALKGILGRTLMLSQIAVVCHDLQKTMATYTKLVGWGGVEHLPARASAAPRHGAPR